MLLVAKMNLYIYILIVFAANLSLTSGSKMRRLDQIELDEEDLYSNNNYVKMRRLDQIELDEEDLYSNNNYLRVAGGVSERSHVVKSADTCNSDYKNQLYIQSYVKRYVNTFLRYTDFKNIDTSTLGFDDFVYGKLNIRIKASHLEELKKFYFEDKPISLSDLDLYLSGMFYNSRYEEFEGYFSKIFQIPGSVFSFLYDKLNITITAYLLVGMAFVYTWHIRGRNSAICILLIGLVVIDAVMKYFVALKKAEIEQYRRLKQLKDVSPTCDPSTYSYFRLFRNIFWEDQCQQLLEDMQIPHVVMVSFNECLFESILHLYYVIPVSSIAKSSKTTVSALAGNSALNWFLEPILSIIIFIILLVGVLILLGANFSFSNWLIGRFSLSFLKGNVINSNQANNANEENARPDAIAQRATSMPNLYLNVTVQNQQPIEYTNVPQGNPSSSITYQPIKVFQNFSENTPIDTTDPTQIGNQSQNRPGESTLPICLPKENSANPKCSHKDHKDAFSKINTECGTSYSSDNRTIEDKLLKDIIDGILNKLKVSDENVRDNLNNYVSTERRKMDSEQCEEKNNECEYLSSNTKNNLGSTSYSNDSNIESLSEKNELDISAKKTEISDVSEEELGAHFEIVGSAEKSESREEQSSDVLTVDVDCSLVDNVSNTSSELDLGAEVESIKSGLRSLIDEDDFVNIQ